MNKSYRSIWNESLGAWVAASELTASRGKRSKSSVALAVAVLTLGFGLGASMEEAQAQYAVGSGVATQGGSIAISATGSPAAKATGISAIAIGTSANAVGENDMAFGKESLAQGGGGEAPALAFGNMAQAVGQAATAFGVLSNATGYGTLAVGYSAEATAKNAVAFGTGTSASGTYSTAVGSFANAVGADSVALGRGSVTTAAATQSVALGNAAQTSAASTVAIGDGANASNPNAVALGAGSATAAAVATPSTTINGTTYNFAGIAPGSTVSVGTGVVGGERTITNVAAGRLNKDSTDAINGSQLYATNQALTVTNTLASKGMNVTTARTGTGTVSGTTVANVAPGETATYTAGNNIAITQNGKEVQIATSATPTFTSVNTTNLTTTGVTNLGGVTNIGGALNVNPSTTVNMGGNVITNVAAGVNNTDVVNMSQLNVVNTLAGKGWNIQANGGTADKIAPGDTLNVVNGSNTTAVYDAATNSLKVDVSANPSFTSLTTTNNVNVGGALNVTGATTLVGGTTISKNLTVNPGTTVNMGGNVITNVAAGVNNTDVVNMSQLNQTNTNVTNLGNQVTTNTTNIAGNTTAITNLGDTVTHIAGDTSTTYTDANGVGIRYVRTNEAGLPESDSYAKGEGSTAVGYNATSTAKNAVALGRDSVASQVGSVALGANATTAAAVGTAGTTINGKAYTFAGVAPVSTVSVGSVGAERTITNVAAGRLSGSSTDAINGSQLYATNQAVEAVVATAGAGWNVQANGDTATNVAPASTVQFIDGKNVAITRSGSDITVATSDDVSFTSVNTTNLTTTGVTNLGGVTNIGGALNVNANTTVNMGGNTITNVAAGVNNTDVVNVEQLNTTVAGSKTHYYSVNDNDTPGGNYDNDGATGLHAMAAGVGASAAGGASVAMGAMAAANGTSAVAIGHAAGQGSTGASGVLIGSGAGKDSAGDFNSYIGAGAGSQASGSNNSAFGSVAGSGVVGNGNAAFGYSAGEFVTGNANTAIGVAAGWLVEGDHNAAMGSLSGIATQGASNLATGTGAGMFVVGNNNLTSGSGAGIGLNGDANVAIGKSAGTGYSVDPDTMEITDRDGNVVPSAAVALNDTVAVGNNAYVAADGAVAIGAHSTTKNSGDVALGSSSATDDAVGTASTVINGTTYNFAGTTPTSTVSVGSVGAERTITNVAAGRISGTSTDAINGSQLYATNQAVEAVTTTAGAGWNVQANGDTATNVAPASTVQFIDGKNVAITRNGSDITVGTSDDVSFTTVNTTNLTTTGVTNLGGVTNIGGALNVDAGTTVNMGGNVITNVANGAITNTSTEVVNGSQLFETNTNVTNVDNRVTTVDNRVTALADTPLTFTGNTGTVDRKLGETLSITGKGTSAGTYSGANLKTAVVGNEVQIQMTDAPTFTSVTTGNTTINDNGLTIVGGPSVTNVGINANNTTITNVAAGVNDTDAVNVSQLTDLTDIVTAGQTHYYSVNDGGAQGGNYDNKGAEGVDSLAAGKDALAAGSRDVAVGAGALTTGQYGGTAVGGGDAADPTKRTTAGQFGTAIGYAAQAKGVGDTAVGTYANTGAAGTDDTTNSYRTAIGYKASTTGVAATAVGSFNRATGERSFAGGYEASALGNDSVAIGSRSTASFDNNVALGNDSADKAVAKVNSATITGVTATLKEDGTVEYSEGPAITYGKFAGANEAVGVVSVGSATATRQIVNLAPGEISASSTDAINGSQLYVVASQVSALGGNITNIVNNASSHFYSVNGGTKADGNYANDGATVAGAIASGINASATAANAVAVGTNASASTANSVALGNDSTTTAATATAGTTIQGTSYTFAGANPTGVVSVGSDGAERQIQNVAAGQLNANSTDAVNGSQLYATNQAINNLGTTVEGSKTHYYSVNDGGTQGANYNNDGASGINAIASGVGAAASGAGAIAIGSNAVASSSNGVAIGTGSSATRAGMNGQQESFSNVSVLSTQGAVSVGSAGNERQITNVAGGTQATDAVNVRQLQAMQQGGVRYDTNADGTTNYNSVTLGNGQATGGTTISNVAPGVRGNDAVNVNQLNGAMGTVNNRIDGVEKNAYAGVAAAMAVQMPGQSIPGKTVMRIGYGVFKGQSAMGVSFRRTAENNGWSLTGGVGLSRAGAAATVGAEWVFN